METKKILIFCLVLMCSSWIVISGVENRISLGVSYDSIHTLASLERLSVPAISPIRNLSLDLRSDAFTKLPNIVCLAHLRLLFNALGKGELWALKFFDSWGKIPAGILQGKLNELGHFTECVKINKKVIDSIEIRGKYCLASVSLGQVTNLSDLDTIFMNFGTCLPDSCNAKEFDEVFTQVVKSILGITLNETWNFVDESMCSTSEKIPLSGVGIGAIVIFCVLVLLTLISTSYDYYITDNSGFANTMLISFSLRRNTKQLFEQKNYENVTHVIPCLNGIRCMSLIWVIYGHDIINQGVKPNINLIDVISWSQDFWAITMRNGVFAVDSFFFLSGLLVVMGGLREMDRNRGKLSVLLMYLNRYLRLTPLLAFAIMVWMGVFPHFGSGPFWKSMNILSDNCKSTWWTSLLYVQNFVKPRQMCLGHAWYLAVDTQLFVFAPLAIVLLHKWARKGLCVIVIIGMLLFACLFSIIMVDEVSIWKMYREFDSDAMQRIYSKTHTRALPWIVGVIFGYLMYLRKGRRPQLSGSMVIAGWAFTFALLGALMYCLYPFVDGSGNELGLLGGAFYYTFSRIGWPLVLCWIVFACQFGYGGVINKLLSWSYWQPFAKLSYGMYIWHFLIQIFNYLRVKTNAYFSDYDVILAFWSDFGLTLCLTLVTYLFLEAPLAQMQSQYLKKRRAVHSAANEINKEPQIEREY